MNFLAGSKTYILCILWLLYNGLRAFTGDMSWDAFLSSPELKNMFESLAGMTLRKGFDNSLNKSMKIK